MKIHFELHVPYGLKELFSREAHRRASELRDEAEEVFEDNAPKYLCTPHMYLQNKTPLAASLESEENHKQAMNILGQIKYGVYL